VAKKQLLQKGRESYLKLLEAVKKIENVSQVLDDELFFKVI